MKSNKLLDMLDSLDSYVLTTMEDEITINHISVFCEKKRIRVDLHHLPSKSFKIFSVNDVVLGYIYFRDGDCTGDNSKFFDNFNDDSEISKISRITIQYENEDLLDVKVHWNSLVYGLDNEYSILLFMGEELDSSVLDLKGNYNDKVV